MGKEKRLFLLAVMTVMMSTVGYGDGAIIKHTVEKEKLIITAKESGKTITLKQLEQMKKHID